jgi:phosphatidylglycerophosphate synthase
VNRYVNPANAITVARYAALPVFTWAAARGEWQLALIATIYCGFLDLFDGAVARKLGCASGFGELLDAVTDAICYGYMLANLVWVERIPAAPTLAFLGLGVVNVGFRAAYARRAGRTTNYRSFAMERVVAYTAYLIGFGVIGIEPVYYAWTTLGLMVVVLAHDAKRMLIDPVPAEPAA